MGKCWSQSACLWISGSFNLGSGIFNLCFMMNAKVKPEKSSKKLSSGQNLAQHLCSYISGSFAKVCSLNRQRMKKVK